MTRSLKAGRFVQIAGTYDLHAHRGEIASLQPASAGIVQEGEGNDRVHLTGYSRSGDKLFEHVVHTMVNSCAPNPEAGTFEELVPALEGLARIDLTIDGERAAEFVAGQPPGARGVGLAAGVRAHALAIASETEEAANVSYTVQARASGSELWETVAVGLPTPDRSDVDINQFPGAVRLEVRVLQNNGLTETEVFRDEMEF